MVGLFPSHSLVATQHLGLITTSQNLEERKWELYVEPFIADLKFSCAQDLLDATMLRRAYKSTLLPMLELARTLGFSANWTYQRTKS